MSEQTGSLAFRCLMDGDVPDWRIERHGDAVITWACDDHLILVLRDLERAKDNPTKFTVFRAAGEPGEEQK